MDRNKASPARTRSRSNGVTDAIIAAAWLNAARSSQTRARVLQIRDQLETLEKMLDSLCRKTQERRAHLKGRTALPPPEKLKQIHEDAELQERLRVSHNALNDALSAYACPVMTYDVASGAWRSNMISRKSRGPQIKVPLEGERVAVVDAPSVVDALVRLAASRQLYKLRLCDQCKTGLACFGTPNGPFLFGDLPPNGIRPGPGI